MLTRTLTVFVEKSASLKTMHGTTVRKWNFR